jgi:hypothetical protein
MTALDAEGFELSSGNVVESFARNFMVALDAWQERGFEFVARSYLDYMPRESGLRRDIAENGDLTTRRMASPDVERVPLLPQLAEPQWYDAVNREPRI